MSKLDKVFLFLLVVLLIVVILISAKLGDNEFGIYLAIGTMVLIGLNIFATKK